MSFIVTKLRLPFFGLLLPMCLSACANRGAVQTAGVCPVPVVEPVGVEGQKSEVRVRGAEVEGVRQCSVTSMLLQPVAPPLPIPAAGGDEVAEAGSFTLDQLEQMALQANPTLQQLAAVVDKARGVHEQVGKYPNPIVGYQMNEAGNEGTAGQQGGFISQTIVTGDKLQQNRDVASWNVQEFSWRYQTRRHRVLNDVRLHFYDALGAQRRVDVAKDLVKVADDGVKTAKLRLKALRGTRADVLQATVDLNQVRILQQNAEYDAAAAWKRLTIAVGRTDLSPTKLAGELKTESPDRDYKTSANRLLEESPQLQAARSRVQGARLAIARQESQPIPNLLAQFGAAHDNATGDNIVNFQIGLPVPVFNRNEGNIQTAWAEYHRAIRESQRLELQLRDTLTVAFREFRKAKFQVERYEKDILPAAKENLAIVEKTYKAGQLSFLRVLTARRTYFEANLRYVESQIALRKAAVVIDGYVLTGGLTDVPDFASRSLSTAGQRGQALTGQ